MAVPNTFTNGTVADADKVNENFDYVGVVPVGSITSWLKNFGNKRTASVTSISAGKLVDTAASFDSTYLNKVVSLLGYSDANNQTTSATSYTLIKTVIINASETDGVYVTGISGVGYSTTRYCNYRCKLYFVDETTEYTSAIRGNSNSAWIGDFTVATQTKKVWKIEYEAYTEVAGGTAGWTSSTAVFLPNISTYVSAVNSGTQLSIASGIFNQSNTSCLWAYKIYKTNVLEDGFVECNGQVLSDAESIYNGETIPNLNGDTRVLRGLSTSGNTTSLDTFVASHAHDILRYDSGGTGGINCQSGGGTAQLSGKIVAATVGTAIPMYSVVFIIRVK